MQQQFMSDLNDPQPSPPAQSPPIPVPKGTPSYPYTPPSYNGSFGSNSDLNWGGREIDDSNDAYGFQEEYNPRDFDVSDHSPSFNHMNFFQPDHLQPEVLASLDMQTSDYDPLHTISLTPADPIHKQFSPRLGDAPSPSSSAGSGNEDRRSRASSVSSVHTGNPSPMINNFRTLSFDPVLDAQAYNQSSDAPQFSHTAPSPPSSPPVKPQSPPALLIPNEGISTNPNSLFPGLQAKPMGGGGGGGGGLMPGQPSIDINIVPSTPVSGGVANNVAFQQVLRTLNQNTQNQTQSGQGGVGGATDVGRIVQDPQPPFAAPNQPSPRPHNMEIDSHNWSQPTSQYAPQRADTPSLSHYRRQSEESQRIAHSLHSSPTITPAYPRSDPSMGLVNLQLNNGMAQYSPHQQPGGALLYPQTTRGRSRSDTALNPPTWGPNAPPMLSNSSLGGLGLSMNGPGSHVNLNMGTVDPNDVSRTPPMYPLSADAMHTTFRTGGYGEDTDALLGVDLRRSRSAGHQRGARSEDFSPRNNMFLPNDQDVLRSITTPDGSLAPSDPRNMPLGSPRRRRHSPGGSHERGASLSSSARPSPYPSPSASPLPSHDALPNVFDNGVVSRPHVTTPATANASSSRRKSEANFMCPVPGCGSTFTRHFNLKGHLRSHNEERPFKCKWPGCEKGFARQHDCKRHEALHLNIRPYTCEGCGKTFARMDALNRHLRSEGGVECRRLGGDGEDGGYDGPASHDADDAWQPGRGAGLVL